MHPFSINGRTYLLDRSNQELANIDLVRWLENQPLFPKVYWKERDGHTTYAAVGNLLSFSQVPRISTPISDEIRFYGGMRFSSMHHAQDSTWQGFPPLCFWLPQIELSQTEGRTEAVHYGLNEKVESANFESRESLPTPTFSLLGRQDTPGLSHWEKNVQTALQAFSTGELNKLVLARRTTLQFASAISPWLCLNHLIPKAKHATVFAFQLSPSLCFLGATPEKLFERKGTTLNTDVIASTRPRGKTLEEDLQFEQDLLCSAKEQREFHIVKEFLENTIAPLSREVRWSGLDRVLKTSHVQHIYNRLNAQIGHEISDEQLINALHPTPSLGGFPSKKALALLRQIEPFDRGWYGAPIGMISSQRASLYVAIRSALIQQRSLHLFAGTGLVQGSVPHQEWEELEHKIRPFAELFL
jgi:menaquinone-specific isochorismate synthase